MKSRSVRLVLITLLVMSSSSGCGGGDSGAIGNRGTGRPYTVEEVRSAFAKATGHLLFTTSVSAEIPGIKPVRTLSSARSVEASDGTIRSEYVSEEVRRAYGEFVIRVYVDQAARDDAIDGRPNSNGIYWSRHVPERGPDAFEVSWTAEEPYGANVLLSWTSPRGRKETTPQWTRLRGALSALK
jgi:hypothetical protein